MAETPKTILDLEQTALTTLNYLMTQADAATQLAAAVEVLNRADQQRGRASGSPPRVSGSRSDAV